MISLFIELIALLLRLLHDLHDLLNPDALLH